MPSPAEEKEEKEEGPPWGKRRNLSIQRGGSVQCKAYCRAYNRRPPDIQSMLLCSGKVEGVQRWPRCLDYDRCLRNSAELDS